MGGSAPAGEKAQSRGGKTTVQIPLLNQSETPLHPTEAARIKETDNSKCW